MTYKLNADSNSSKRVRGPTRGKELEKLLKVNGKMVINIPLGKGRPVCEVQSAKLLSELGVISRQFVPIPEKWKNFTEDEKRHAFERLEVSNCFKWRVIFV